MQPRIIVFEDDPVSRKLITLILEEAGYEVISAVDPTMCPLYDNLDAQCTHVDACGDFLLTDNQMPRMTGLEFVETQGRRGCKGVVQNKAVISAALTLEQRAKAEDLGCKVFRKPFRIEEILTWVEERKKLIPPDRKLTPLD